MQTGLKWLVQAAEVFPAAVVITDREGIIRLINGHTETLFGYTRDELLGRTVEVLVPEKLRGVHERHRDGFQKEPASRLMGIGRDLTGRKKDGTEFPIEVSLSPAATDDGLLVVGLIQDISARKRAELELRRSEERFRSLVENAVFGIYRRAPDGRFLSANPALQTMLGCADTAELLTLSEPELFSDPAESRRVLELLANGRISGLDVGWTRRDGRKISVRLSGRAVSNEVGEIAFFDMLAEDVTQRLALEEQFRHAQKMEAIGRLADSIVHDFNNLMAVISAQSELLLDELAGHPQLQKEVELMAATAEKAAALTKQLLKFSRKKESSLRSVWLNALVSNIDQMLLRLLPENIELSIRCAPETGNMMADPGQIEQVVMNLVVNARDAMSGGGRLTIETSNAALDALYAIDHFDVVPGQYVMIAVTDTGVGMSAETRARLFEPFFTTKPVGEGTGLGLSTVYAIVRQVKGHIWVYSEPGNGTTFRIYFPRTDAPALVEASTRSVGVDRQPGKTILLVEDEDRLRGSIRQILLKAGYHVLEASDGAEALSISDGYSGTIDVVLSDIGLPRMRGPEAVSQLLTRRPSLRVIYMSGFGDSGLRENNVTVHDVIEKPFRRDVLLQRLRDIFAD